MAFFSFVKICQNVNTFSGGCKRYFDKSVFEDDCAIISLSLGGILDYFAIVSLQGEGFGLLLVGAIMQLFPYRGGFLDY